MKYSLEKQLRVGSKLIAAFDTLKEARNYADAIGLTNCGWLYFGDLASYTDGKHLYFIAASFNIPARLNAT